MYQNQATEIPIKATLSGVPVTGLISSNFIFKYWKKGAVTFTTFTTTVTPIAYGNYSVLIPANILSEIGGFLLRVEGVLFDTFEKEYFVDAAPIGVLANPDMCIISGSIIDIGGNAGLNKAVTFRIVNVPKKIGTSLVTADRLSTTPDALGNISMALVRGSTVLVEILSTGIRQQIVIPNQPTALLIDLLPPIP